MAKGATLVRKTRANSGQAPGGPTAAVSRGSMAARPEVKGPIPPAFWSVLPKSTAEPRHMIIPNMTSIMVMDL